MLMRLWVYTVKVAASRRGGVFLLFVVLAAGFAVGWFGRSCLPVSLPSQGMP